MIAPNLFNIFDPSTSHFFSTNWIRITLTLFITPYTYWILPSRRHVLLSTMHNYINKELQNNLTKYNYKSLILFFRLFWYIIWNNLIGLYPYIFTATRHLTLTLTLTLPFWILFILYGWTKLTNHIFIHLVPLGTPIPLRVFIVLIETTSNLIRPITLSVRLAANIIAGHLLLRLLRRINENVPIAFWGVSIILTLLLILEYAVAIIQRYVFITLLSLYLNEIN